jgi:eukaryotic-like serine/threonine-protein kinase
MVTAGQTDLGSPPDPDAIARLTAALAGRYRLGRKLGVGGMATVYLAEDVQHHREVALKVLHEELAHSLGTARFLREIEIASQLQHPNILPLLDSGEAQGFLFYAMPYVEGHSLRQRLTREGELPVSDAVRILAQVVDALAHAHTHGIVHRDIKPDNVMLSGRHALVTDFGVAKAISEATGPSALTSVGVTLGTPAYMSPEQVSADPDLDHRTDIYSVGAMAYEMLTGRPPFPEGKIQQVLAAHITKEPEPLSRHRPGLPAALEQVVMRCLAKLPADRWQSAEEMLARLEPLAAAPSGSATPVETTAIRSARPGRWMAVLTLVAALGVLLAAALVLTARRPAAPVIGHATQVTSDTGLEVQPAIAPDGRYVAYAAGSSAYTRIVMRQVGGGRVIPLTDAPAESEWSPRWSPDGSRILFLARRGVFSAEAFGGPARQEVPAVPGSPILSATWSPDGREIAFVRRDSLQALQVGGGATRPIATLRDLHSCAWSPDARSLACVSGNAFYVTIGQWFGNLAPTTIVLIPAAGGAPVSVTDTSSMNQSPVWSPDGSWLYYVSTRDGPRDIYALPMSERDRPRGAPVRLTTGLGAQSIALAADGSRLAYSVYSATANIWSLPIPEGGPVSAAAAVQVTSGIQNIEGIRATRDGRWLLYDSDLSGNSDIYRIPLEGGDPERLTTHPADEFRPDLSPDGKVLVFHSWRTGSRDLFVMPLDGGPVQQITATPAQEMYARWSPDGSGLAFVDLSETPSIYVMRRDAGGGWGKPIRRAQGVWQSWSPDGRILAFTTVPDGRLGVVPADSGDARILYTPAPASDDPPAELADWSADGGTIYFKSHDARGRASFWSLPATGGRPRLRVRFEAPGRQSNRIVWATDGKRFYFTIEDRQSDVWIAELTAR